MHYFQQPPAHFTDFTPASEVKKRISDSIYALSSSPSLSAGFSRHMLITSVWLVWRVKKKIEMYTAHLCCHGNVRSEESERETLLIFESKSPQLTALMELHYDWRESFQPRRLTGDLFSQSVLLIDSVFFSVLRKIFTGSHWNLLLDCMSHQALLCETCVLFSGVHHYLSHTSLYVLIIKNSRDCTQVLSQL